MHSRPSPRRNRVLCRTSSPCRFITSLRYIPELMELSGSSKSCRVSATSRIRLRLSIVWYKDRHEKRRPLRCSHGFWCPRWWATEYPEWWWNQPPTQPDPAVLRQRAIASRKAASLTFLLLVVLARLLVHLLVGQEGFSSFNSFSLYFLLKIDGLKGKVYIPYIALIPEIGYNKNKIIPLYVERI